MRRITKASIGTLAIIAVLTAAVGIAPAAAAVIEVWPDQVIPAYEDSFVSFPTYFFTTAAWNRYYAPLVLPVGATITKMTLYRSTGGGAAQTQVLLTRVKMGQDQEDLATINVKTAASIIAAHATTSITQPTVEAGYRYFLWFYTANDMGTGMIYGAKVRYDLP